MKLIHFLTMGLLAVLASEGLYALRYLRKSRIGLYCKGASVLFGAVMLLAYLSGNDAVASVYALAPIGGVETLGTAGSFFLVWLTTTASIFLVLWPFFRKDCPAADLFTAFALVVFVADVAFLNDFTAAQTGASLDTLTFRSEMLVLQVGFGLGYAVFAFTTTVRTFKQHVRSLGYAALALAAMLLCTAPNYSLQLFFSPANYAFKVEDLNLWHRIFIYPAAVLPVVIYLVLAGRPPETRRYALLYYGLAGLWNFMSTQKIGMIWGLDKVGNLPLHLCNTACYVIPLCLTFRLKRLFYFTYFINVFGAFLALTIPNYNTDGVNGTVFIASTLHFYRAHYQAFFMPLLTVGLGIFKRPRLKQFLYSMTAFLFYYLAILILNGWFTNYDPGVDFFFINSDFITDKLGSWAEHLRDFVFEFRLFGLNFRYYPIYQSLFFAVYCVLALGMWFLYEVSYRSVEGWRDLARRRRIIRLDKLAREASQPHDGGAPMNDPKEILAIRGFSKRYGRSDVYAVKDCDLTVHGGEIFGFLGPNGAGKSTIIKSIVGIQPITEGTMSVCGYDVERQSVQAKQNIGFVPDHYALYEKLTAREYVNYIADLYGVSKADRDERMQRYVDIFEFNKAVDEPISTYSHGMKQKVAIMAALIHDPKVWILDEPLTGLDPNSIFQVKECMKRHAEAGNVVFFSSHLIDVVERICDRIAIIRKGQIQCVCDVKEIESRTTLEAFYMDVIESKDVQPVPYTGKPQTE